MKLEQTEVKDKDGKVTQADKAVCTVCSGDSFHVLVIHGHNHLQCANPICGESYCQGGCELPQPKPLPHCPYCHGEVECSVTAGFYDCHFCGNTFKA